MKSLSDVIGASGLHGYAEVALVIFFLAFLALAFRVLFMPATEAERAARMPLDDEPSASPVGDDGARP